MKNKFLDTLIVILLTLLFVSVVFYCANNKLFEKLNLHKSQNSVEESRKLFLNTWELIQTKYYDPTLNHQDWYRWKDHYLPYIQTKEDVYVAINSMLASLNDPYSKFMNSEEVEQQNINIDAKITGIGVTITTVSGKIIVVNVIDDSPAQKVDIKPEDTILKVEDNEVNGMSLADVSHMLRGEKGSTVNVEILRNKKKLHKTIVRDEIKLKNVK